MNKRGESETSLGTNEFIGLILTFLFLVILFLIGGKVFLNKGCPAGYDIVESAEFNPSIVKICGDGSNSGNILCCARKSDPLNVCKYYREEKRFDCEKLTEFNFLKVCSDNTACGISTDECSGGYCEKGICLVKDGIGKCVDKFEIDGKEIIADEDSCERNFNGDSVGSSCGGLRHCIFEAFTRDGKCLGGYYNVDAGDAKKECERYCKEARDEIYPLSSRFCAVKFPIKVGDRAEPVEYDCYSRVSPIKTDCSVQCKSQALVPVS